MLQQREQPPEMRDNAEKMVYCPPKLVFLGLMSEMVATKSTGHGDGGGNPYKTVQQG